MRFSAAPGAALLLAFCVARAGLLPCACAEMSTFDARGGHCGSADTGLRAKSAGCTCACMTAQGGEPAATRVGLVVVRTILVVAASPVVVPSSYQLLPPIPLRCLGHSRSSPPLILRV